jgi:phosphopantothenoylcysteine decarboxylase/phosphopantothenate--cysteine ligase
MMSESATQFMTPVTMQALSGQTVYVSQWDSRIANNMAHIELTRQADLMVAVPASADLIAKINAGLADDLISVSALARDCPLIVVPAMNRQMWENPATQRNIAGLITQNIEVLGPTSGTQACGENGMGRMLEAKEIFAGMQAHFQKKVLAGKHVLITAGPTYEAIDPVRGITNRSSGKMGFAIAQAALEAGATVDLVAGPCQIETPLAFTQKIQRYDVMSAKEMQATVMQCIKQQHTDFFFAVAAVADWTIKNPAKEKMKRAQSDLQLEFEANPDILKSVVDHVGSHPKPYCIGFAAESHDLEKNGKDKLIRKNIPLLIANIGPETFGLDQNQLLYIEKDQQHTTSRKDKISLARELIEYISTKA